MTGVVQVQSKFECVQVLIYDHPHMFGSRPLINKSQLKLRGELGRGSFSTVWKANYTDSEGQESVVAVKQITVAMAKRSGEVLAFLREHQVLSALRHKYAPSFRLLCELVISQASHEGHTLALCCRCVQISHQAKVARSGAKRSL